MDIHDHPEVSNYEFYSADALIAQLEKEGFTVEKSGWSSYRVRCPLSKRQTWTNISFLAEYDALPGIGHACGHNLFGTYSVLAASALQPYVDELGGEIRVYGTPGEEGRKWLSKGQFVREGFLRMSMLHCACIQLIAMAKPPHLWLMILSISNFMVGHPMRQRHQRKALMR